MYYHFISAGLPQPQPSKRPMGELRFKNEELIMIDK